MNSTEIGTDLVALCREGKNLQAIEKLYSKDIVSVEAHSMGGRPRETKGMEGVLAKSKWWGENHTIHSATIEGPFPFEDKFGVFFKYDITQKASNKRFTMQEIALYYTQSGKIVREEFFYKGE